MQEILILPACSYELLSVFNVIETDSQMFFSSLIWAEHSDIMTKAIKKMIRKSVLNVMFTQQCWEGAFTFFCFTFYNEKQLKIKQIYHLMMPATFGEVAAFQIFQKELVQIEQSRMRLQVKRNKREAVIII